MLEYIGRSIWKSFQLLQFIIKAKTAHRIHSPFVYDLVTKVFENKSFFYVYQPVETHRKSLQLNDEVLEMDDHGARGKRGWKKREKVSTIVRKSVRSPKYAQLLFRLLQSSKTSNVLELGTSLGVTTLYLSYACPDGNIITVEGDVSLADFASKVFVKFGRGNISLVNGTFDNELPKILNGTKVFDFVFFDGHHEEDATLRYFNQLLTRKNENSVFVFDDIRWSKGMKSAWDKIISHESVTISLDLFEMGIVYFLPRMQKEHFLIRF